MNLQTLNGHRIFEPSITTKTHIMKNFGLFIGVLFIGLIGMAQDNEGVTVTVTIENVLKDGGTILGGLHTEETFMRNDGIANATAPGVAGEVTLTFENVAPGTYAIMVMHDANDNKQMDMDPNTGMPQESYGTSGTMNMYGPPTFADTKFEVSAEDQNIVIRF